MTDAGPHNHECAFATGPDCHCECHGTGHGVMHMPGKPRMHRDGDVTITPVKNGAGKVTHYVVLKPDGRSPGGQKPTGGDVGGGGRKARLADVQVKTGRTPTPHDLPQHIVDHVAQVRASLPQSREEWDAPVRTGPSKRDHFQVQIDERMADVQKHLDIAERRKAELIEQFKQQGLPEDQWGRHLMNDWRYSDNLDKAEYWQRSAQNLRDRMPAGDEADLKSIQYPTDRYGRKLAHAEHDAHLTKVMAVGKAIHSHVLDRFAKDPEHARLKAEIPQAEKELAEAAQKVRQMEWYPNAHAPADLGAARMERDVAQVKLRGAKQDLAKHEQSIIMDALSSVRSFGNEQHAEVKKSSPQELGSKRTDVYAARDDAVDRIREAEKFFPDEWVSRSSQQPLNVISSDRAFYSQSVNALSMPVERNDRSFYDGGFRDDTHETVVHEMGHRMEQQIPGLTHLEYTLVRRRSTKRKQMEKEQPLRNLTGLNYRRDEVAYKDEWADAYTGKTYEGTATNPGAQPWEAFQVGLQETLGRGSHKFDTKDELQHFVLGALATLP